jgi:hypothetical protein
VTAGPRGDIRDITFHDTGYRSMAPAELGRLLVEVIEEARLKSRAEVTQALGPLMGFSAELRTSMLGGTPTGDLLEKMHKEAETAMGARPSWQDGEEGDEDEEENRG